MKTHIYPIVGATFQDFAKWLNCLVSSSCNNKLQNVSNIYFCLAISIKNRYTPVGSIGYCAGLYTEGLIY